MSGYSERAAAELLRSDPKARLLAKPIRRTACYALSTSF